MYTCCPECKTCFRISNAQLAVAQGKVRCGKCAHIFNAKKHLSAQSDPAATGKTQPTAAPKKKTAKKATRAQTSPRNQPAGAKVGSTTKPSQDRQTDHFDLSAYTTPPATERTTESTTDRVTGRQATLDRDLSEKPANKPGLANTDADKAAANAGKLDQTTVISQYDYSDINDGMEQTSDINSILREMDEQLSPTEAETLPAKPRDEDDEDLLSAIDMVLDDTSPQEVPTQKPVSKADSATTADVHSIEQDFLDEVATEHPDAIHAAAETPQQSVPEPETRPKPASAAEKEKQIPLRLRESLEVQPAAKRSAGMILLGIGSIVTLTLLFTTQLALFKNMELATAYPGLQPWLDKFCSHLPCRYNLKKEVDKIKLLRRDVRAHPKVKSALLISAAMVNTADFKQAYPDLMITLFDLSGNIVAKRRFTPADYMANVHSPFMQMSPNTPVQIALEVVDPGNNAINFEFEFL